MGFARLQMVVEARLVHLLRQMLQFVAPLIIVSRIHKSYGVVFNDRDVHRGHGWRSRGLRSGAAKVRSVLRRGLEDS